MKIVSSIACILAVVACSPAPSSTPDVENRAPVEAAHLAAAAIDAHQGSIAGLHTGMTKDQLGATGDAINERLEMKEGDEYVVMDVLLPDGSIVECWFDNGRIERLRTSAEGISDEKGVGVGSTLAALKAAYPDGRLSIGDEEGRYANFVNRSKVVFEMDMDALPQACFYDENIGCDIPSDLRVRGIVVHSGIAG